MKRAPKGYLISTSPGKLDIGFVRRGLNATYWARDRPLRVIRRSLARSLCFGVYETKSGRQVGFARVVTDRATFSWLCDVFIDEAHQGRGLGKWLVSRATSHPDVARGTVMLGTRDAHGLYEKFGFRKSDQMKRLPG
jgi:GNAT superfamily N-acetyltransferase